MTIDWATVDLDAPWQPWTPKVGDRVRIRLSGECQAEVQAGSPMHRAGMLSGHVPDEHGMTGTVDMVNSREYVRDQHPYLVQFDRPLFLGNDCSCGDLYAAAELEPLEPAP